MPGSCFIEDSPQWQNGLQRLTQAVGVSAANLGRPTLERRDAGVLCRAADREPVEPDDHRRVRLGRAAQVAARRAHHRDRLTGCSACSEFLRVLQKAVAGSSSH